MNRDQYLIERSAFLRWAWAQRLKAGSDESGYHDDEPLAAQKWMEWYVAADKKYRPVVGAPMLDLSWYQ